LQFLAAVSIQYSKQVNYKIILFYAKYMRLTAAKTVLGTVDARIFPSQVLYFRGSTLALLQTCHLQSS
jgi:hypothetical protein